MMPSPRRARLAISRRGFASPSAPQHRPHRRRRLRVRLTLVAAACALATVILSSASIPAAFNEPVLGCGRVSGAPWVAGLQYTIGVRRVTGNQYAIATATVYTHDCLVAKRLVPRLTRLRTARALRLISFGDLHCRARRNRALLPDSHALRLVRPATALGQCGDGQLTAFAWAPAYGDPKH